VLRASHPAMSGHSKWSTIKHKKAQKDARRGKLFTKLIKEITVAARMGGGDINANPRLRTAVITARQNSMPADNIDRAIKKGTGELEGVTYEEITYEAYGPGGVAILIQVLTDNKNRTIAEVRNFVQKHGGNMATAGAVAWMFTKRGLIAVERAGVDEDRVMELALEAGAEDVRDAGDLLEVLTPPDAFEAVKTALEEAAIGTASAEVTMIPSSTVAISGKPAEQMVRLLEVLEDHDDVQSVSSNMDIAAEELERLSA
jgi:YebC/PmpR family DNA-binding regulatory protein